MSGNTIYRGLCSTCKYASSCTLPADTQRPAFYCEEFEIEIAPVRKVAGDEGSRLTESSVAEVKGSSDLLGLCSDCENSQACVFPKPEGGVWHCEEYR